MKANKKTIWYISKYFEPKKGKFGGRAAQLMCELTNLGYTTIVITSDSNNLINLPKLDQKVMIENSNGVQIIWLKTIQYNIAKSFKRMLSWIHFEFNLFKLDKAKIVKPDAIVISSLSLFTILNGILLKHKYGCKLILEIRDIWPLTLIEEGGFSRFNPLILLLGLIEKIGYKHADTIVGTMPNLSEHVQNILKNELTVHCIPMGISSESICIDDKAGSNTDFDKYIPPNKFIVLYAGTIGITNALDTLFQCALHLNKFLDIHFVVLGDGALIDHYKEKFGNLSNLSFIPKVSKQEVSSILSKADLLYLSTFPSKVWNYGQSLNKLIDYMASGKPILASYNGFPSMINEAQCGYFIPASDIESMKNKILQLKDTPQKDRDLMGKRGRDWLLQNRTYPKLALEYAEILFN